MKIRMPMWQYMVLRENGQQVEEVEGNFCVSLNIKEVPLFILQLFGLKLGTDQTALRESKEVGAVMQATRETNHHAVTIKIPPTEAHSCKLQQLAC